MDRVRVDAVRVGARRVRGLAVTGRVDSAVVVAVQVVQAVAVAVKGAGGAKAVAATVMPVRWVRASASSPS
ncbi:hypothetical protein [Corallococcus llansteffanensis]|uniref:hypothetical protein n=1 Tax=Corallococcus llansteffanensis TaxID=2316731 RepID=UPI001ABFC166|nr:hypothetical protein [Corallococcus llansteffanensis]